jgi:hypothetical protein
VYGVIEDSRVTRALDAAINRWTRAQDAWDAVVWTVARDPECGSPVTESGRTRAFTLEGARSIDMPKVTIIYVISIAIVIHDARFEEATYSQAGTA